jgi:hypothetical protein
MIEYLKNEKLKREQLIEGIKETDPHLLFSDEVTKAFREKESISFVLSLLDDKVEVIPLDTPYLYIEKHTRSVWEQERFEKLGINNPVFQYFLKGSVTRNKYSMSNFPNAIDHINRIYRKYGKEYVETEKLHEK